MIDSIYHWVKKYLLWFQYKPADEREATMFNKAYQRSFYSLFVLLIVLESPYEILRTAGRVAPEWLNTLYTPQSLQITIGVILVLAYLAGSSVFRGQEMQFKYDERWYWRWALPLVILEVVLVAALYLTA